MRFVWAYGCSVEVFIAGGHGPNEGCGLALHKGGCLMMLSLAVRIAQCLACWNLVRAHAASRGVLVVGGEECECGGILHTSYYYFEPSPTR